MNEFIKKFVDAVMIISLPFSCIPLTKAVGVLGSAGKSITGYVAGGELVYSADVYWAENMMFVFDNGAYNSTSGSIECSLPESDAIGGITSSMVEKDSTVATIKRWYGFDGIRNRVIVLNRSNAAISAKYDSTINADVCGDSTTSQLYDYDNNDNYAVTISETGEPESFDDENDKINRFGNETLLDSTTKKIIPASTGDGKLYANKVFLNITGTPIESFTNQKDNAAEMGTITIILSKDTTIEEPDNAPYNTELVKNSNAELGMANWATVSGTPEICSYSELDGVIEKPLFCGGWGSAESIMKQDVDISEFNVAKGDVTALMSADLGGWLDQGDNAIVKYEFKDSDNKVLEMVTLGPVTNTDRNNETKLITKINSITVPTTASYVTVTVIFNRDAGASPPDANDGYADNISFKLIKNT